MAETITFTKEQETALDTEATARGTDRGALLQAEADSRADALRLSLADAWWNTLSLSSKESIRATKQ
jgi:electron transfer flavoprotein alpha/beta subunit|tara:strand:+ start:882 stop:1082 length:201 start_codon:yes stop_codon:yes gene_type:complete